MAPNLSRDQAKAALRQFVEAETRRLEEAAYQERQKPLWLSAPDPAWSPAQYGEYLDWGAKLTATAAEFMLEFGDKLDPTSPDFDAILAERGFDQKDRFFLIDYLIANQNRLLYGGDDVPPVEYLDELLKRIGAPVTKDNKKELCRLFLVAHAHAQRQTVHARVNEVTLLDEVLREKSADLPPSRRAPAAHLRASQALALNPAMASPPPASTLTEILLQETALQNEASPSHDPPVVVGSDIGQPGPDEFESWTLSPEVLAQAAVERESSERIAVATTGSASAEEAKPSLIAIVEDKAASKTRIKDKTKRWTTKTARQHVSLARLFVKMVGSDDPRDMQQRHILAFRYLLDKLPYNHGRSSKDASRPLTEILKRGAELPADKVGLAGTTIDRYMTEFGTILEVARAAGFVIGDRTTLTSLRVNADSSQNGHRSFTEDELRILSTAPVWTGRVVDSFVEPGDLIVHDAYYWAPLIVNYSGMRLSEVCAATLDEIDANPKRPQFDIADTEVREVKSAAGARRIPIHPELIRLGFLDYVAELRRRGETLLFPDLRARGANTPLGNLFDKYWSQILDHALPNARKEKKTFHSFRRMLNTAIANAREPDVLRKEMLGHAKTDVNEISYTDELEYQTKLAILTDRTNVTSHLVRRPLKMWDEIPQGNMKWSVSSR